MSLQLQYVAVFNVTKQHVAPRPIDRPPVGQVTVSKCNRFYRFLITRDCFSLLDRELVIVWSGGIAE